MWLINLSLIIGTILGLNISLVNGERQNIHRMIYETFDDAAVCFRILNGTHEFGCSSSVSGNTGVVHFIENTDDLTWVLQKSSAGPYAAVVHPTMFNRDVMMKLNSSPKISGILLVVNGTADLIDSFSPDDVCPNRYSGLTDSCDAAEPWNPLGTSFLFVDWNVPMFIVKDLEVVKKIYDCFVQYNLPLDDSQSQRALCSLQLRSHMHAAVDSRTCMYRNKLMLMSFNPQSYCDPMGDRNIVSTLFPRTHASVQNRTTILVVARLDSTSIFDGLAPGAMSAVSGIATLLMTSKILKDLISASKAASYEHNVMFALFSGEAQGYIGSSRVIYDMKDKQFPISDLPFKFDEIEMVIDISQMSKSKNIVSHYKTASQSQILNNTLKYLNKYGNSLSLNITEQTSTQYLPPSSVQPFLKEKPSLPAIVMANHGKKFVNRYYNSFMDDDLNLEYTYGNGSTVADDSVQNVLANISVALAQTLYTLVTGAEPTAQPPVGPVVTQMDELLYCYLKSANCELFRNVTYVELPSKPFNLYVGVARSSNTITEMTALVLMLFSGTVVSMTEETCTEKADPSNEIYYKWLVPTKGESVCLETTVKLTPAMSPAFLIDDYNWTSGEYSTWTESVWQELNLRMFLRPSRSQEIISLLSGLAVIFISFVTVYWVNSRADLIFNSQLCARC